MKNYKKLQYLTLVLILAILCSSFLCITSTKQSFAIQEIFEQNYQIFEGDTLLFERPQVCVGDIIITKDFDEYEVYMVDETTLKAKVKKLESQDRPMITKKTFSNINANGKKIGLYMTHNDECYLDGDGTDSIYGKGGIHDVANRLAYYLRQKGVNITIDETLHIPHNSSAYTRSKVTAQKLLDGNPNAIFDIHRDGVSRSCYATKVDGKERSQIRIVVGQANPNKEQNLKFAKYLMSVADVICPWLFADIYYAKGNYNQNLSEKALLFEMGTYTIEKELVMDSVPELANVIVTTLFATTVDEKGNLIIGDLSSQNKTIDKTLGNNTQNKTNIFPVLLLITIFLASLGTLVYFVYSKMTTNKEKKQL